MSSNNMTIVGNVTADPELRYTQSGVPVANFTIAYTPRIFDRQANEWKDGDPLFLRVTAWRDLAENVAATLSKGSRVVATGKLQQKSWESKEGEKRSAIELELDDIGPSLKHATAKVTRTAGRSERPASEQGGSWGSNASVADQGWAERSQPSTTDEPPF